MLIPNLAKIAYLHNSKKNEIGYILSNGPSLQNENLSKLKGKENIITLNASPLMEEKYGFHSSYYCLTDPRFLEVEQKRKIALNKLKDKQCYSFCRENLEEILSFEGVKPLYLKSLGRDGFSKNLIKGFYFGATTSMLAIQLAYWLGLKEVYILGLDLDYLTRGYIRFYDEKVKQVTDLLVSVQIFNISNAANIFEQEGRKLYITNPSSWATPYVDYKSFDLSF